MPSFTPVARRRLCVVETSIRTMNGQQSYSRRILLGFYHTCESAMNCVLQPYNYSLFNAYYMIAVSGEVMFLSFAWASSDVADQ